MKILFVCTQNVFRSMSAHMLLEKYLSENGIKEIEVSSAGTVAYEWESPFMQTIEKLKEFDIDASSHKNRKINQKIVDENDLIICMTQNHKNHLEENFGKKVFLFNEVAYDDFSDLCDDTEVDFNCSIGEFINNTIDYINEGIPFIAEKINLEKVNSNI